MIEMLSFHQSQIDGGKWDAIIRKRSDVEVHCQNCGAEFAPNAAFCGLCGAQVCSETSSRYTVFKYDAEYAKGNHAYISFIALFVRGLIYCLAPLLLMFLGEDFIVATICLFVCGMAALIIESCIKRKYFLARQSAVVVDMAQNTTYYVTMIGDADVGFNMATQALAAVHNINNSARQSQIVQVDSLVINEVERFQAGQNRYNIWSGGEVRVRELNQMHVIKKGKRYFVCYYTNKKGRLKTMKIPNCFPMMKEDI